MPFEKNPDEIGCLWTKSSAKGDYMTGQVNGEPIVVFAVHSKSPKAPQWRILKAKPRDPAAQRRTDDASDF